MIKDILLHVSKSYTPYIPQRELWGAGNAEFGSLDNEFNSKKFMQFGDTADWKIIQSSGEVLDYFVIGIKNNGTLWGWGPGYSIGINDSVVRSSPVQIGTLSSWVSASVGEYHTLAIQNDGTLWSWGRNSSGELGTNDLVTRSSPVQVGTRNDWIYAKAGALRSYGKTSDGIFWCWGSNRVSFTYYSLPIAQGPGSFGVIELNRENWSTVSVGSTHMVGVKNDGTMWSFGSNSGKLGINNLNDSSSPVQIGTLTWVSSSTARDNSFAIRSDGTLWSWGTDNSFGELGLNDTVSRSSPVQIGTDTWVSVSPSDNHVLAVKSDGTLWGWGIAADGRLAQPEFEIRKIDDGTTWVSGSLGGGFTSALKSDGSLWMWGTNESGFLGQNDVLSRSSPIQVGTLSWKNITSGVQATLAIKDDDTLWSWGLNTNGALGLNLPTTNHRSSPVQVGTLLWKKVHHKTDYTLAIRSDNTMWAWGNGASGKMGLGNVTSYSSPVQVGTRTWTDVVAGRDHSLAIRSDGTLWAWGLGSDGQLGIGSFVVGRSSPVQIGTRNDWTNIAVNFASSFARRSDGTIWMWGVDNNRAVSPVQIGTRTDWRGPFTSATHNSRQHAIINNDGTLWVWGKTAVLNGTDNTDTNSPALTSPVQIGTNTNWIFADTSATTFGENDLFMAINSDGELYFGPGTNSLYSVWSETISRSSPVQIGTETNWASVQVNNVLSTGTKTDGTIWAWGKLHYGFDPASNPSIVISSPKQVNLGTINELSIGKFDGYSYAIIKSDGTLWTWGLNASGQLGLGNVVNRSSPVQVGTRNDWKGVSVGNSYTISVRSNNTLWSWGIGTAGQLGLGGTVSRSSPVQVGTKTNWSKVFAGNTNTAAITDDTLSYETNYLYTTGISGTSTSELSNGWGDFRKNPVAVNTFFDKVSATDPNSAFGVAISDTGTLWAWGQNVNGTLGTGDSIFRSSPVQIGTLNNWKNVSNGNEYNIATKTDGTLWVWGANSSGNLGLGNTISRSSPVQVGTLNNWDKVSASYQTSYVIKTDGTLWAWGNSVTGKLGNGSIINRSSPVQIGTRTDWSYIDNATDRSLTIAITDDRNIHFTGGSASTLKRTFDLLKKEPIQITTGEKWSKVANSTSFTIAIDSSGSLWGFGSEVGGVLGNNSVSNFQNSPVQIGTLSNWANVYAKAEYVIATKTDGTLWSWGQNESGQLGLNLGTTAHRSSPVQVGTNTWYQASTGRQHAIAIRSDRTMWGWGLNSSGQLGLGNAVNRSSPVQIGTLLWSKVSAGFAHTVAILSDGTLWSWGNNSNGELAQNNLTPRSSPVQIGTLSDWIDVSAGASYTLAIRSDRSLWGWGANTAGQLASLIDRSAPNYVDSENKWTKIETNYQSALAIAEDGTLWSWGSNNNGILGNNTSATRSIPSQISNLSSWSNLSIGVDFAGAIKNGELWVWGNNVHGQLGTNEPSISRSSPVQVGTLTNWSKISFGYVSAYGIKTDGTLWSWGHNGVGQLGLGDSVYRSSPVQVGTNTNWIDVTTNQYNAYALSSDGKLWACGINNGSQLGLALSRSAPNQIDSQTTWNSIDIGAGHRILQKEDGKLWTWGSNSRGQLGLGDTVDRSLPVQIGTKSWKSFSAGSEYTLAVDEDGTLWAWGSNQSGKLGNGLATVIFSNDRSSPIQIGTLSNWSSVSAGSDYSLAIKTDGTLWSWGLNTSGQLGLGDYTSRSSPVQVGTLNNWDKVSASYQTSYAIKTDGTIWGWGTNTNYVLSTIMSTNSPVQLGSDSWINISQNTTSIGSDHRLGIGSDGTLWAWGDNTYGQLGLGDTEIRSIPVQVGTLSGWVSVTASDRATYAIRNDGTLWSWGWNTSGILGTNDTVWRSSPVQVGTLNNWVSASANSTNDVMLLDTDGFVYTIGTSYPGYNTNFTSARSSFVQVGRRTDWSGIANLSMDTSFTMAIKNNGTLWGWGQNGNGQLGTNNTITYESPVQIGTLTDWKSVTCANQPRSMGIKTDGTLWAWGNNSNGILGLGDIITRSSPVQVGTLNTWVSASIGDSAALLLQNNGYALSTGGAPANGYSQNLFVSRSSPIQIGRFETNNESVDTPNFNGSVQVLVKKSNGSLWSWGTNISGQLGDGTSISRSSPVQIGNAQFWVDISAGGNSFIGIQEF